MYMNSIHITDSPEMGGLTQSGGQDGTPGRVLLSSLGKLGKTFSPHGLLDLPITEG